MKSDTKRKLVVFFSSTKTRALIYFPILGVYCLSVLLMFLKFGSPAMTTFKTIFFFVASGMLVISTVFLQTINTWELELKLFGEIK